MGSGANKKKLSMGDAPADVESLEAQRWCIRNNICISPIAVTEGAWKIEIINRDKKNVDPTVYGRTEIWNKLFEYCKFYYKKYGDRV